MPRAFILSLLSLLLGQTIFAEEAPAIGPLLEKVANHYRNLGSYETVAQREVLLLQGGQTRSFTQKLALTVGKEGRFHVEQTTGDTVEIRVSDGKTTWKALPKQKIWSKLEVTQLTNASSEDDLQNQTAPQDLFSQTQSALIGRYTGLDHYAKEAELEKNEKLKFNGDKVDCYVVRISTDRATIRMWVAKESLFVLRYREKELEKNGGEANLAIEYKKIAEGVPDPRVFDFEAPGGSKQVAEVTLPSERNVSWEGRPAADFTLKTVDGTAVRLADLKGKVVLLDFWATWCPSCREELPTIEALSRKYSSRNVVVFGVNDESPQTVKRFLGKHVDDMTVLHDGDDKVHRLYGCYSIPTVMVINTSGTVVAHFIGGRPERDLVAALKQAGMQ